MVRIGWCAQPGFISSSHAFAVCSNFLQASMCVLIRCFASLPTCLCRFACLPLRRRPELLQLAVDLDAIKLLIKLLSSKAAAATATATGQHDTIPTAGTAAANGASSSSKPTSTAAAKARAAAAAAATAAAAAAAVQLRRGCLAALAALAMHGDVARTKMVSEQGSKLVQLVVAALSDADADVRAAAALCLRGLCRSARLLRGGSIPAAVAGPLVALLQDAGSSEVQVSCWSKSVRGCCGSLLLSVFWYL
jgi:hypothetical protein